MSRSRRIVGSIAVCLLATAAAFSQISFERQQYSAANYSTMFAIADLNSDGATDLIVAQLAGLGNTDGFVVYLSNGDGTFQPPVPYAIANDGPSGSIVTADFNSDGKADVVAADGSGFLVYLGNGDGTLRPPTHFQLATGPLLAAADVNHDGRVDLVLLYNAGVSIMYGNGDGTFQNPIQVYTVTATTTSLTVGDFDGDGNIDVEINGSDTTRSGAPVTTLVVLYGDGKGKFSPVTYNNISEYLALVSADVNQDGRSDLVGGFDCAAAGCGIGVQVYYGNADRTLTAVHYPTKGLTFLRSNGAIGDFNGDGRLDVALAYDNGGNAGVAIFPRSAAGAYASKRLIPLLDSQDYVVSLLPGDFNRDRKTDLATTEQYTGSLQSLLNTTSGKFTDCQPPNVSGIHVCNPSGGSVQSPVKFDLAASSFEPIRKIEVWIDGVKRSETYFSWGLFAFSRPSISVNSGSHRADIYAGNWDGHSQHTTFGFTVK
jgi:hypothetical protein